MVVPHVCVCVFVVFAENASFRSYGLICLPRMLLTAPEPQNTDTNGIHARNVGMTLLFVILTKNASFRSYSTFVYLLRVHIPNINMRMYITSAHGHELSGFVRADADAYNLTLIFTSYYYAPWPCMALYCV